MQRSFCESGAGQQYLGQLGKGDMWQWLDPGIGAGIGVTSQKVSQVVGIGVHAENCRRWSRTSEDKQGAVVILSGVRAVNPYCRIHELDHDVHAKRMAPRNSGTTIGTVSG